MIALRTLAFTILVPGTVVVAMPWVLRARFELMAITFEPLSSIGVGLVGAGLLLYLLSARDLVTRGHGTPAPFDPPKALVVSGPYRFVRNPIYVAVCFVLTGEAIWFGSASILAYAAFVFLGFHLRVVYSEEPALKRKFGDAFGSYCEVVPRWLPRRRPARSGS